MTITNEYKNLCNAIGAPKNISNKVLAFKSAAIALNGQKDQKKSINYLAYTASKVIERVFDKNNHDTTVLQDKIFDVVSDQNNPELSRAMSKQFDLAS